MSSLGTEQRQNYAAVNDAQIMLWREDCAASMTQRSSARIAAAKEGERAKNIKLFVSITLLRFLDK